MKSEKDIRTAYRARFNQVRREAKKLAKIMKERDVDDVQGVEIADMRDHVEIITQAFHEFNAYWSVANTGDTQAQKEGE